MYETIAILIGGFVFAYLYTQERDNLLKFLWLITGLSLVTYSFFADYSLSATTLDSITGITTYTYILSNNLNWAGIALGGLLLAVIVIFLVRFLTELIKRFR